MKSFMLCAALLFLSAPALAAKSCDELKTAIAAKVDAKKVEGYTLEILAKDQASAGKVVGSCDGGKQKIVYSRAAKSKAVKSAAVKAPAAAAKAAPKAGPAAVPAAPAAVKAAPAAATGNPAKK